MRLHKLQAAERNARKAHEAMEDGAKLDPSLVPLVKKIYDAWKALLMIERELQVARKADKGEILWTVFSPIRGSSGSVREVRRTSHRKLSCYHWRHAYEPEKWHEHVRESRIWEPWHDLADEMRRVA